MREKEHENGLVDYLNDWFKRSSDRREMLRILAGAAALPLVACASTTESSSSSSGGTSSSSGGTSSSSGGSSSGGASSSGGTDSCTQIPSETGGPYPGDGTNGPNVLTESGIVRSDIRTSYGTMSGTAVGIDLTVTLKVVSVSGGCTPLAGYVVYLWHCNADGLYSLYTLATENYLRGVQETDANGQVTFTTKFPGCYDGRWPHIHFEVFASAAAATSGRSAIKTSQLALPKDTCDAVYATTGYEASPANLAKTSLSRDNVFSDGSTSQVAMVTGSVGAGYTATLVVGV